MYSVTIISVLILILGVHAGSDRSDAPIVFITPADTTETGFLGFDTHKFNEGWRYHPGDNTDWAEPGFDDSSWYNISPNGLQADEMPDSLWPGYGWWRFQFKADSALYQTHWNLAFDGWGAAEVYLDGELVRSFGKFSKLPANEITYSPPYQLKRPNEIEPREIHTIAIRYSFHKAKKYHRVFRGKSVDLGFGIGFSTPYYNEYLAHHAKYLVYAASFTGGILLILLLMHLVLFLRFPEDRTNLVVAMIILSLLISSLSVYSPAFIEYNALQYIIRQIFWMAAGSLPFFALPYLIAILFRLKEYYRVIHLAWGYFIFMTCFYLDFFYIQSALIFLFISFLLCGVIFWKAYVRNKTGLIYISAGFLLAIISVSIYWLHTAGLFSLSLPLFHLNATLVYSGFPFGLSLYITHRYGLLFESLENQVRARTVKLQKTLENLQATQEQLVQQEKLASLGQLTAGIAHEIKNPLNFVNNFSDLSVELIDEVRDELSAFSRHLSEKSPLEEGGLSSSDEESGDVRQVEAALEILNDIEANLKKIHEHGTRADGIVKSMLQHSRGGSGKMEPTDLNTLVKEFVNLSFHGMRAGKNPINVEIDLQLDESVGDVPLVAEDFSRVILNICNNAFDAMREKANLKRQKSDEYLPLLKVQTNRRSDQLIVEIEDNGPGIPEAMKDKIFQPFFTSKKGTEGTGLGLSISNDIVKAHGGSIEIESKAGNYTRFLIKIPTQTN